MMCLFNFWLSQVTGNGLSHEKSVKSLTIDQKCVAWTVNKLVNLIKTCHSKLCNLVDCKSLAQSVNMYPSGGQHVTADSPHQTSSPSPAKTEKTTKSNSAGFTLPNLKPPQTSSCGLQRYYKQNPLSESLRLPLVMGENGGQAWCERSCRRRMSHFEVCRARVNQDAQKTMPSNEQKECEQVPFSVSIKQLPTCFVPVLQQKAMSIFKWLSLPWCLTGSDSQTRWSSQSQTVERPSWTRSCCCKTHNLPTQKLVVDLGSENGHPASPELLLAACHKCLGALGNST